jgi:hypothetical protein
MFILRANEVEKLCIFLEKSAFYNSYYIYFQCRLLLEYWWCTLICKEFQETKTYCPLHHVMWNKKIFAYTKRLGERVI